MARNIKQVTFIHWLPEACRSVCSALRNDGQGCRVLLLKFPLDPVVLLLGVASNDHI